MADVDQFSQPAGIGDVVAGKYRIEGVLGVGGMGIVFAATHLHLERLVAVKVMRAELTDFPGAVQRLVLEAKLAARLRSEHVCKVLDVGTLADGAPYVVMEYLEGADLATLLGQQGALPTQIAVDFMLEACEALAEAHALHIVHRDLKPENLFVARTLDGTSAIKVLDFGISKQRGVSTAASRHLTNPTAALGSPNYMPPEQMRAPRDVDARADIWAIGAILYELLTGRQAFSGETVPEVCAAVMSSAPVPAHEIRPDLPRRLVQAVDRCLQRHPQDRFADVNELAVALGPFGSSKAPTSLARIERVLSGAHAAPSVNPSIPVRVTPISRPSKPRPSSTLPAPDRVSSMITTGAAVALLGDSRRRRRPLWIAALVVTLLAAGGFVMAARAKPEPPPPNKSVAAVPQAAPARAEEVSGSVASKLAADATASSRSPTRPEGDRSKSASGSTRRVARARPIGATPEAARAAPAAAATSATSTAAATGAWNVTSFGPRR
jgi:eukaryotic-like serine/threonine-protein kinase